MIKKSAYGALLASGYFLIFLGLPLLRSDQDGKAINTPRGAESTSAPFHFNNKSLLHLADSTTPTLSVSSLSTFVYQIGGSVPPDQSISVASSGNQVSFSANRFNYAWINVNPTTAVTPAQIAIGVNPSGMTANTYTGSVTIDSAYIGNGPISLPVTLLVVPAGQPLMADLVVNSFTTPSTGVVGSSLSGATATVVNTGSAPAPAFQLEYFLSQKSTVGSSDIDTGSGCAIPGLAVGSTFTCSISIGVPPGITPGTYYMAAIADPSGVVTESSKTNNIRNSSGGAITLSAAPSSQAKLAVTSFLAPTSGVAGGILSGASVIVMNNGTADAGAFRLEYFLSRNSSVTTSDIDTGWGCDLPALAVNAAFECGGDIGLPGNLATGTYYLAAIADANRVIPQTSRSVNARNNDNGPIAVVNPVTMSIAAKGVVDPFTFDEGIAPGAWVTIYGSNLSSTTQNWNPASDQAIATTLGGVSVKINGVAAPLSYVSPTQINLLAPSNAGEGPASVVVTNKTAAAGYSILSSHYLPALYCIPATGTPTRFYATGVDPATGEFVGNATIDPRVAHAVRPGETIDVYGTGFGPPSGGQFPTGTLFSAAYPLPLNFTVVLGGVWTPPLYAALVGPGLYQVRFTVPASAATGDLPVYLDFGSAKSSQSVYLTVHP